MSNIHPRQALNKAFLKVKPNRIDIDRFKGNLIKLLDNVNENESEEFNKNLLAQFFRDTYYGSDYFINTKERSDLVIHQRKDATHKVNVILEVKNPTNNREMVKRDQLNCKAFQELLLYYLRERITGKNFEIKHLVITNIYQWFIFDGQVFDRYFAQDKDLVKQFNDFEAKRLSITTTDLFYQEIAQKAIAYVEQDLIFTYFDLREYQPYLQSSDPEDERKLIPIFKIFSPEHLLKLPFINDSNSLDKNFYNELLYIIGLTETKQGNKKLIERQKEGKRDPGSFLENAISQIESMDKLSRLENLEQHGENESEQLFNIGLELVITWINRILFLKLLEAQLIKYHQNHQDYAFLNLNKVGSYNELNSLFLEVLARKINERQGELKQRFADVPYLNSSLFELTELEQSTIVISNLKDANLAIFAGTVLKDEQGKKRQGALNTLQYLFEFLNAYDFSSEGSQEIQEENKTLINAAVLGLIFEKINGYKDGSFFTPGFITMYICKETLTRAILQKFREKGYQAETIDQLYDKITDKQEANQIINSIKICDPAVGSGHFLVSALNEIIAIKHKLTILLDRQGIRLQNYDIEVVNDELIVTDKNGELFTYNPKNKESQRIQEALFHEKQTLIENCLFGVDINPNSVKICRLRLWIELLKNAYYKSETELETLPNIDINIKVGNSLISRFTLEGDLKAALRKSKSDIQTYQNAVQTYRNAESKQQKREMLRLIQDIKDNFRTTLSNVDPKKIKLRILDGERYNLENQSLLFEESPKDKKAREKKINKLNNEIDKLKAEIEEIESGKIYLNAFEWRFEFPEVLDNEGKFIGFDIVIGNPPYIRQEEIKELKPILGQHYQCYTGIADLFVYFYERGYNLLKPRGYLTYISSNKYFRSGYGEKLRQFLTHNTTIHTLIDFGDAPVFDEAIAYPSIIVLSKVSVAPVLTKLSQSYPEDTTQPVRVLTWDQSKSIDDFTSIFEQESFLIKQQDLTPTGWRLESNTVLQLLDKLKNTGIPLGEYVKGRFYRGVLTGFNEAFIVDRETRDRLIHEHPSSEDVLKPFLRGKDIKRWVINNPDLWLVFTRRGIDINQYPAILNHLSKYRDRLTPGIPGGRKAGSYKWYEIQDNIAYYQEFEMIKITWGNLATQPQFSFADAGFYINAPANIIVSDSKYLLGILNSQVTQYLVSQSAAARQGGFLEYKPMYISQIPILTTNKIEQKAIETLVTYVLYLAEKFKDLPSHGENLKEIADDKLMLSYFEQILDALVMELYLPEELHTYNKYFMRHILQEKLPSLEQIKGDKVQELQIIFRRLFDKDHPIRVNIYFLNTLETVRIIRGEK